MSAKKQKQGWKQAPTEAQRAERVCGVPGCEVRVPGCFTWPDPATQQPRYGTLGEAEEAVGQRQPATTHNPTTPHNRF